MKYIIIISLLLLFASSGCIDSSPYKETGISELLETPANFEGKQVLVNGVFENGTIQGIRILESENFTGEYRQNGVLASVYGTYENGSIAADSIEPVLVVSTERYVYHSNDTLKVRVEFISSKDGKGKIEVAGINNFFGRPLVAETRDFDVSNGSNYFDFLFKTPSCEECSAFEPGVYQLNATVTMDGRELRTFKKILLQRDMNVTEGHTEEIESPDIEETLPEAEASESEVIESSVTVEYFFESGCPKCAKALPVIENVVNSYDSRVKFIKYNATGEGFELAIKYQIPGVPSVVINRNKDNLISYQNYEGDTVKLELILRESIDRSFASSNAPVLNTSNGGFLKYLETRLRDSVERGFTLEEALFLLPLVIAAGAFVGFNPCLLAILVFIASITLASTGRRRNVLLIVLMFSLGIFLTYLISGVFFLKIIEYSPSLDNYARNFSVILVGLLGLWHVYDAYHLRKYADSSFYTPKSFIRLTESVTEKVSLPAAFLIGALFSLIKAGCLIGPYLIILNMVKSGSAAGIVFLAAFNLGIVLPVIILGAAIAFGLNPEKVEKFRKEKRSAMRLFTGVTLLIIAYLMHTGILWR